MNLTQTRNDLWPVPGSKTLTVLFPDIAMRFERGLISEDDVAHLVQRRCIAVAVGALQDMGLRDRSLVEDLAQELPLRLARMNAAERYDPALSSPVTYLHGVMRLLVTEQYFRRERPVSVAPQTIERVAREGSELERMEREELYRELYGWLDQLSRGELRAVINAVGAIEGYSPTLRPPRHPRNPDALPKALELLAELGAQSRQ